MKKKLKEKNFRYLKKMEIQKPLQCLHLFYKLDVPFRDWRRDVELLLLSGLDGRLKRNGFEHGLAGQRLIKQIELAYVLYVQADIKNKIRFCPHAKTIRETYNVLNQPNLYLPVEALVLFFEYQSLTAWREEVDSLIGYASIAFEEDTSNENEEGLIVYTYTMAMIDALYELYQADGMEINLLKFR